MRIAATVKIFELGRPSSGATVRLTGIPRKVAKSAGREPRLGPVEGVVAGIIVDFLVQGDGLGVEYILDAV